MSLLRYGTAEYPIAHEDASTLVFAVWAAIEADRSFLVELRGATSATVLVLGPGIPTKIVNDSPVGESHRGSDAVKDWETSARSGNLIEIDLLGDES